jgi:two-component sensor histidine kinase
MSTAADQLNSLADHLAAARAGILRAWHDAVAADPQLTTASTITRAQFNDHIPQVLDSFEHRLRAHDPAASRQARVEQHENAAEHGLHRWQQGYDQGETMREWGHLHLCVLRELDRYEREHPELEDSVMAMARMILVQLCADGVCESAMRYTRLQQAGAASRLRDLERALQELQLLDRRRAETWREAAHDLRGTIGVITNASAILSSERVSEQARTHVSEMLRQNVASLRDLLSDLLDQARLEAGQDQRRVAPFDAAVMLREFCDSMRALANERNLFLKTEGPASLPVEGDAVKVRRIVQNLVLNALNVTQRGGVRVTWEPHENPLQWIVCVQDTGPGFDAARAEPLERDLKEATAASHEIDVNAESAETRSLELAPTLKSRSEPQSTRVDAGEGIGLSIVKRLCELLDASLELQTAQGTGTTFRVILPRQYKEAPGPVG